ncbi:hypothetical protein FGO68_gene8806 [Halteria grandinella]|uniref:Uncharacterized protein n=1 Tax=Halteria grandinella TaxID=5974 RepID=A0A8J8NFV3_HALGN|nr:hypothetical protein FGO68_gene8806 [Halteria grandinella]
MRQLRTYVSLYAHYLQWQYLKEIGKPQYILYIGEVGILIVHGEGQEKIRFGRGVRIHEIQEDTEGTGCGPEGKEDAHLGDLGGVSRLAGLAQVVQELSQVGGVHEETLLEGKELYFFHYKAEIVICIILRPSTLGIIDWLRSAFFVCGALKHRNIREYMFS